MIDAFKDLSTRIMETCDKDVHELDALKTRELVLTNVMDLFSQHFKRINDKASKRVVESLRNNLKECEPTFQQSDRIHQQLKKQLSFLKGATNTSKSEHEMENALKQLSSFFSEYLVQKNFLEKLTKINVSVDLEIDDAQLVEFLLRFVKLKVEIDNKKKIEVVVSSKHTRLEEDLIQKNQKLQKERDEAVKKQKEETNLLKDKTLLLSKEVKAKELQIIELEGKVKMGQKVRTDQEVQELKNEIQDKAKKNKELEDKFASLQKSTKWVNEKLEKEVKNKESEIKSLEATIRDLKSKVQTDKGNKQQATKHKAQMSKFEDYLKEVQDKLDKKEKEHSEEKAKLEQEYKREKEEQAMTIAELKERQIELEDKLKIADQKVSALQQTHNEMSHEWQLKELERQKYEEEKKLEEGRYLKLVMLVDQVRSLVTHREQDAI